MASGKLSWQEEHVAYFREIVPGHSHGEIADMFEDRFGIRLSVSQVKNAKKRFHVLSGTVGGRFKPRPKGVEQGRGHERVGKPRSHGALPRIVVQARQRSAQRRGVQGRR